MGIRSGARSCRWAMARTQLAIKADVRDVIHKAEGDTVDIHLTERLG